MVRYKFILFLITAILVSIGIVWLFLNTSRLLSYLAQPPPQLSAQEIPLPSSTPQANTPNPLPSPTTRTSIGPFVSQQAPAFSLKTRTGDVVKLEDNRGKVVLLNFWASWCIPCKEEMPLIQAAYEKYRDRGLVVWGINMTDIDDRDEIDKFVQETGVTFPILLDESGAVGTDYRVISIPTSFFIDRTGIIQHFQLGAMTASQMDQYLEEMLP